MKYISLFLILALLLTGCSLPDPPPAAIAAQPAETTLPFETTLPSATAPAVTVPSTTAPLHSDLYIPDLSVAEVIRCFHEVCLDAEFVNSGSPNLLQKWDAPIYYALYGDYTQEDLAVLEGFAQWLNTVEGFPGFFPAEEAHLANLDIYFCSEQELLDRLGDHFSGADGGVTFWYDENNVIYDAIICCRTDISQTVRNSVILEEIYNGLGPVQDTALRPDSIIYSGYSEQQELTDIDVLILKLLYHPMIKRGMNAEECEAVIRQLYH